MIGKCFNTLSSRITASFAIIIIVSMSITAFMVQLDVTKYIIKSESQNANNTLKQIVDGIDDKYSNYLFVRKALLNERKSSLARITQMAITIISHEYALALAGKKTMPEAKATAKNILRFMRYDNKIGYVWIQDTSMPIPFMVMHPLIPKLEGKPGNDKIYYEALDGKQNLLVRFVNEVDKSADQSAFIGYKWPKLNNNGLSEMQPKFSHIRLFEPWGWIVGTGAYTDDIERVCKNYLDSIINKLEIDLSKIKLLNSGYVYIFNGKGDLVVHPVLTNNNKDVKKRIAAIHSVTMRIKKAFKNNKTKLDYMWTKPGAPPNILYKKVAYFHYYKPLNWYIVAAFYEDELTQPANDISRKIMVSALSILIIATLLAIGLAKNLSKPLSSLAEAAQNMDANDLTFTNMPASGTKEFQSLALSLKDMFQRLKSEQLKNQRLINNMIGTFLFRYDSYGKIQYVSKSIISVLGYSTQEFLLHFRDYLTENPINNVIQEKIGNKHYSTATQIYELEIFHKDGSKKWISVSESPVFDESGNILVIEGVAHDVTERKQSEQQLLELRNYLSNIINSIASVLICVDTNGKITQWNKQAELSTNISADDAKGQQLDIVIPYFKDKTHTIDESIRMNKVTKMPKHRYFKSDSVCYEDITIYPLISGAIQGAVIRIDDVTQQVQLENMMVQSEKMSSIAGLAAGMAHEINNPLAGIMQGYQNILNRIDPKRAKNIEVAEKHNIDLNKVHEYLKERKIIQFLNGSRESCKRAATIVKNMLLFSRKPETACIPSDLSQIITHSIELGASDYDMKRKYDFKFISITKELSPDVPYVSCCPTEIEQVLLNLFKNAVQATENVQKSGYKPQLKIKLIKEKQYARIEIEDNGPGIPDEIKNRIFEPFFTTKPLGFGTGLGLSVSYSIITQNHGGTFEVESEVGKGTKFIIRLPL